MLLEPGTVIGEVVLLLREEDFHMPYARTIFALLVSMDAEGIPVDAVTLQETLIKRKLMDKAGGPTMIAEILSFVPDAGHAEFYCGIVKEKSVLRHVIELTQEFTGRGYDAGENYGELLDDLEASVLAIRDGHAARDGEKDLRASVLAAVEKIEMMIESKGAVLGLPTGFRDFDRSTGGLTGGQMVVIAARPGMGKTSFAMNIAENVACDQGKPVGVFSLEMGTDELVQRLLFSRARVDASRVRKGILSKGDMPRLMHASDELAKARLLIDDTPGISILELRAKARRMQRKHGIEMIVVDYLQLMRSTSKKAAENRQVEVSEISAGLKGLAKELGIPLIVLAQLNRNAEGRAGGIPKLADLRESGSIEQDADIVGLLYREDYYAEDEDERKELEGQSTLIVAKHRNGPVGEIPLTFQPGCLRFSDRALGERQT
jgi:replicative DNA helicase